jgi:hypothetical protein
MQFKLNQEGANLRKMMQSAVVKELTALLQSEN